MSDAGKIDTSREAVAKRLERLESLVERGWIDGDVVDLVSALSAALEEARGALEWIVNPSTGMSHVIFRQEAMFKAKRALATINAALGRVEG